MGTHCIEELVPKIVCGGETDLFELRHSNSEALEDWEGQGGGGSIESGHGS